MCTKNLVRGADSGEGPGRVTSLFLPLKDAHFSRSRRITIEVSYFSTRLCGRGRMKNPGFQISLVRLVWALALTVVLCPTLRAEPPTSSRSTRPQVIYHVRPMSNYAATLHSQAKTQSNEVPSEVPIQPPRVNANTLPLQQPPAIVAPPKQRTVGRPKIQRSQTTRRPDSGRPKGNSHGNKSHKR